MCDVSTTALPAEPPAGPVRPGPPSIGRIVHYWHRGSADGVYPPKCSAALVTGVPDPAAEVVSLTVFCDEGGMFPHAAAAHDEGEDGTRAGGTWHWPEYVQYATPPVNTPAQT